jgi:hypothetical protein
MKIAITLKRNVMTKSDKVVLCLKNEKSLDFSMTPLFNDCVMTDSKSFTQIRIEANLLDSKQGTFILNEDMRSGNFNQVALSAVIRLLSESIPLVEDRLNALDYTSVFTLPATYNEVLNQVVYSFNQETITKIKELLDV